VILYEALTGQNPFAAKSPPAVLLAILERQPIAPRELSPLCSARMESLCLRLLAKNPEARPGLEAVIEGLSLEASLQNKEALAATLDTDGGAPFLISPEQPALADTVFSERSQGSSNKESSIPNRQVVMDAFSAPMDSSMQPKRPAFGALHNKEMPPLPPERRYEIVEEFARGGLGRILRAYDKRLGRPVAMKEILRKDAGVLEERFLREALITAKLEHPSIIPIHDLGRWESGSPFYTMKLVSGRSLDKVIDEKKTFAQRLSLLPHALAVCEAVAYAHTQKIIHRDLKPANILVGSFGETVVIDWGIAKDLTNPQHENDTFAEQPYQANLPEESLTKTGAILGTPAYMSLEQARGQRVDERADVYSLGAILYQVLCGEPPYVRKRNIQVLAALTDAPPTPIQEKEPALSGDLAAIVQKAMAREAKDRYPTAAELAEDLRRFQAGQLVGSHRYSLWELIKFYVRRYRNVLWMTSFFTLALFLLTLYFYRENSFARRRAESAEQAQKIISLDRGMELAEAKSKTNPKEALSLLHELTASAGFSRWDKARDIASASLRAGVPEVLSGQSSTVSWLAVSAQGVGATGGYDGSVSLWDAKTTTGRRIGSHEKMIREVTFSASGRLLASTSNDYTVKLWDATEGRLLFTLEGHLFNTHFVAFSPDEKLLASSSYDRTVRIWDTQTGKSVSVLSGYRADTSWLAFSPDGTTLASTCIDGTIRLSSVSSLEEVQLIQAHQGVITSLVFSRSGEIFITAGLDGLVKIWRAKDRALLKTLSGHQSDVYSAVLSLDGAKLASGDTSGNIIVWSVDSGERLASYRTLEGGINRVAFSPDGLWVAAASQDGNVYLGQSLQGELKLLRGHQGSLSFVAFSDGSLWSADRVGAFFRWDLSWIVGDSLLATKEGEAVLGFLPSSQSFLIQGSDYLLRLARPAKEGIPLDTIDPEQNSLLSPNGKWLAVASSKKAEILLWELATPTKIALQDQYQTNIHGEVEPGQITSMAFSLDGVLLASGSKDRQIRLWDTKTATKANSLSGHTDYIDALAFAPDGMALFSASEDRTLRRWSLPSGVPEVIARDVRYVALQVSPDGKFLAAANTNNTIDLWDLSTGTRLVLEGTTQGQTYQLVFSADGKRLLVSSMGGLFLWYLPTRKASRLSLIAPEFAAFSPDQKAVWGASRSGVVEYHDDVPTTLDWFGFRCPSCLGK
jgi:eukaryotic-like serine/threonine-protein kinase